MSSPEYPSIGPIDATTIRPNLTATQPPAAPETDVRLTDAERDYFRGNLRQNLGYRAWVIEDTMLGHVERIVAERVRVVEGERDAARAELRAESRRADKAVQRANHYEGQFRTREREPDQRARAESAEAENARLRTRLAEVEVDVAERVAQAIEADANEPKKGSVNHRAYAGHFAEVARAALASPSSLAQRDAEVGARLLREAADEVAAGVLPSHPNGGYKDGFARAVSILRARADALAAEAGGES
jgi:hypothetical protein